MWTKCYSQRIGICKYLAIVSSTACHSGPSVPKWTNLIEQGLKFLLSECAWGRHIGQNPELLEVGWFLHAHPGLLSDCA